MLPMYCTIDRNRNLHMKPDENDNRRMGTPLIPQRSYVHTPPSNARDSAAQVAAANIVRSQIGAIYGGETTTPTPQTTPVQAAQPAQASQTATQQHTPTAETTTAPQQPIATTSPYQQTQVNPGEIQKDQWKQYHSAWQDYYQKYYERYYVGQVQRTSQAIQARAAKAAAAGESQQAQTANSGTTPASAPQADGTVSRDEALFALRNKLRGQIQSSAVKVRRSRHFMPIAAATCVVLLFLFLQYNRILIANVQAYISPGNVNPANIIVAPNADATVSPESKIIIPKINVDVPVDYNATPDNASQMAAMRNGVAYFGIPGANSLPGQIGNTAIAGHSSNDLIDQGNYKFAFLQLEKLAKGDTIYLNYESKRYTYSITRMEVVKPSEINKLIYPTDKPVITLITCTPIGTATNRLLVTAEQISPSPSTAAPAPVGSGDASGPAVEMPGNSPTFMERVFGG